jgi:hypothetical protein
MDTPISKNRPVFQNMSSHRPFNLRTTKLCWGHLMTKLDRQKNSPGIFADHKKWSAEQSLGNFEIDERIFSSDV